MQAYRRGWLDGVTQALSPKRSGRSMDTDRDLEREWRRGFDDGRRAAAGALASRRAELAKEGRIGMVPVTPKDKETNTRTT